MGRKRGKPLYRKKKIRISIIIDQEAFLKVKTAERNTGRSRSDAINHWIRSGDPIVAGTPLVGRKGAFPAATSADLAELAPTR